MEIVGRQKMAQIVDITVNGLVKMEDRGLPIQRKGLDGNVYDLKAVVGWLKEDLKRQLLTSTDGESVKELVARRAMAETRTAEIELAKLEGSLADVEMIRQGLENVAVNQRTIALSVAAQIGREIDEPDIRVRVVAIVDRRIREMLEVLANYDPVIEPHHDEAGAGDGTDQIDLAPDPSSTKAEREPVGRAKKIPQPRRRRVRAVEKRDSAVPD